MRASRGFFVPVKKQQSSIASYLAAPGKKRTRDASIQLLNDFGLADGEWCLESKLAHTRIMELVEEVPLFVRVLAFLKLATMGYLPSAAGVPVRREKGSPDIAMSIDQKRYDACKKHGAVLAVTQLSNQEVAPIGPGHVRNGINKITLEVYRRQLGRELDDEEKVRITSTFQDIRRALEYLEDLGFCFRTDPKDVPLAELKKTEKGRLQLKRLAGDNKIRIYILLRPLKTQTTLTRHTCLVHNVISMETKPLYRQILRLGLKIDPQAFEQNPGLQATIRAELDEREKLLAERDDHLRQTLVAAGAVPLEPKKSAQVSTVSNPTHVRVPERPLQTARQHGEAVDKVPGPQRQLSTPKASGVGEGDRALVSQPRGADVVTVNEVMRQFGASDLDAATQLIAACRAHDRGATVVQIADAIAIKGKLASRKGNPVGFLISVVPKLFEGTASRRERERAGELQRKEADAAVIACSDCVAGIVGGDSIWKTSEWTAEQAAAAIRRGAKLCACETGLWYREAFSDMPEFRSAS